MERLIDIYNKIVALETPTEVDRVMQLRLWEDESVVDYSTFVKTPPPTRVKCIELISIRVCSPDNCWLEWTIKV